MSLLFIFIDFSLGSLVHHILIAGLLFGNFPLFLLKMTREHEHLMQS